MRYYKMSPMENIWLFRSVLAYFYLIAVVFALSAVSAASSSSNNNGEDNDCRSLGVEYQQFQKNHSHTVSMLHQMSNELSSLETRRMQLIRRTEELNGRISHVNRQTLEKIAAEQRKIPEYQQEKQKRKLEMMQLVRTEELNSSSTIFLDKMMNTATAYMKEWIENLTNELISSQNNQDQLKLFDEEEPLCIDKKEALDMIVTQVHSFFTGQMADSTDFASLNAGSKIVYANSLTSDTFFRHGNNNQHSILLEYWKLFLHSVGLKHSTTTPPEHILSNAALHIGSCWPMKGTSGQVTIQFPFPVRVTHITIEHVSPDLEPKSGGEIKKSSSAPRFLQLIGYPECTTNSNHCSILGFDLNQPILLNQLFEYNRTSYPLAQTFPTIFSERDEQMPSASFEEVDETNYSETMETKTLGTPEGTQCSVTSCAAAPSNNPYTTSSVASKKAKDVRVKAVTLVVKENWGNEDYTCMYRVRVHGDRGEN